MRAHAVPPSQRVLFIPELVDIIFNLLDRKTNATNALVCKQWSQIALDVVWKEVDDLLQLFRLLKPIRLDLHKSEEELYAFYVSHLKSYYGCCLMKCTLGLQGLAGRR
jgi:hypothetical protein